MPRASDISQFLPDPRVFRRRLLRWFERAGRDLPWRRTRDPYAILVSEVMLQQTQVATVLPYYRRWLERFPNFAALARATEPEVLHAWQGLGYYGRARNLHATAKNVTEKLGGQLPQDPAAMAQLPGIGRYTSGAIASFAFDRSAPVVEGNIARLLARLTNCKIAIDTAAGRARLWQTAELLVPRRNARTFNSALMDLGATVCLPRRPRCGECPVSLFCCAQRPETLPVKRKRPGTIHRREAHGFSRRRHAILLEQSRTRWRGMWILPRLTHSPRRSPLFELDFPFTHHRITLAVYETSRLPSPNENQNWFSIPALERLPMPTPHRRALAQLLSAKRGARIQRLS